MYCNTHTAWWQWLINVGKNTTFALFKYRTECVTQFSSAWVCATVIKGIYCKSWTLKSTRRGWVMKKLQSGGGLSKNVTDFGCSSYFLHSQQIISTGPPLYNKWTVPNENRHWSYFIVLIIIYIIYCYSILQRQITAQLMSDPYWPV